MVTTNPSVNLTLVTVHDSGDVVFHDVDQGASVSDRRNPVWQLGVPHLLPDLVSSLQ